MAIENGRNDFGNNEALPGENLVVSQHSEAVSPDVLYEIEATEFFPSKSTQKGILSDEERKARHKAANHKWYESNKQGVVDKVREWRRDNKTKATAQVQRYRAKKRQKQQE